LILGLPEDTPESFLKSLEFVLSLETQNVVVFVLEMLPGTEVRINAEKYGIKASARFFNTTANTVRRWKKRYKRMSAEQIKVLEDIRVSAETMRRIWRRQGISNRRRRKHVTKQFASYCKLVCFLFC